MLSAFAAVCVVSSLYLTAHFLIEHYMAGQWLPLEDGWTALLARAVPEFFMSSARFDAPFVAVMALASEYFKFRAARIYLLAFVTGALASLPVTIASNPALEAIFFGLVIASGLLAGYVYWLIAGRNAGFQPGRTM